MFFDDDYGFNDDDQFNNEFSDFTDTGAMEEYGGEYTFTPVRNSHVFIIDCHETLWKDNISIINLDGVNETKSALQGIICGIANAISSSIISDPLGTYSIIFYNTEKSNVDGEEGIYVYRENVPPTVDLTKDLNDLSEVDSFQQLIGVCKNPAGTADFPSVLYKAGDLVRKSTGKTRNSISLYTAVEHPCFIKFWDKVYSQHFITGDVDVEELKTTWNSCASSIGMLKNFRDTQLWGPSEINDDGIGVSNTGEQKSEFNVFLLYPSVLSRIGQLQYSDVLKPVYNLFKANKIDSLLLQNDNLDTAESDITQKLSILGRGRSVLDNYRNNHSAHANTNTNETLSLSSSPFDHFVTSSVDSHASMLLTVNEESNRKKDRTFGKFYKMLVSSKSAIKAIQATNMDVFINNVKKSIQRSRVLDNTELRIFSSLDDMIQFNKPVNIANSTFSEIDTSRLLSLNDRIAPSLAIAIRIYTLVSISKGPAAHRARVTAETYNAVKGQVHDVVRKQDENGQPLEIRPEKQDIITGFAYGDKIIEIDPFKRMVVTSGGPSGLTLLGFVPEKVRSVFKNVRSNYFLCGDDKRRNNSTVALGGLIQAMKRNKVVAVGRLVSRDNRQARMVLLSCHKSSDELLGNINANSNSYANSNSNVNSEDDDDDMLMEWGANLANGLHITVLPYSDDVRTHFTYEVTSNSEYPQDLRLLDSCQQLLDLIELNDATTCLQYDNLENQHLYRAIQAIATKTKNTTKIEDPLAVPAIWSHSDVKRKLVEIKSFTGGYIGNNPNIVPRTVAKRKRNEDALEVPTTHDQNWWVTNKDRLGELTIPPLKKYLTYHKLPVGNKKKSELIDSIILHIDGGSS